MRYRAADLTRPQVKRGVWSQVDVPSGGKINAGGSGSVGGRTRAGWLDPTAIDGIDQPTPTKLKTSATTTQAMGQFSLVLGFAERRTSSSSPLYYITYKTAKGSKVAGVHKGVRALGKGDEFVQGVDVRFVVVTRVL